jgi:hypothetical protein
MSKKPVMWDRVVTCYQKNLPDPEDIDLVVVDNDVVSFYKGDDRIVSHRPGNLLFDLLALLGYKEVTEA